MSSFAELPYEHLIVERTETQRRLFRQAEPGDRDFDVVVVGSGMGGGILADDLADRFGSGGRRVLVIEAGSYLVPTHVYNVSRFPNADVARWYTGGSFTQPGDEASSHYIHEQLQMNLGGRSVW